jgi:hypothetical protein
VYSEVQELQQLRKYTSDQIYNTAVSLRKKFGETYGIVNDEVNTNENGSSNASWDMDSSTLEMTHLIDGRFKYPKRTAETQTAVSVQDS